jgi:hypothetical protein
VVRGRPRSRTGKLLRVVLGVLAAGRVHQAAPGRRIGDEVAEVADHACSLVRVCREALDRETQVGTVEARDHLAMVTQPQPVDDVCAHRRRRRGRQRDRPRVGEAVDHESKAQVVRPELMSPRGDAVRLVHDEQGHVRLLQHGHDLVVRQLLGGEEHVLRAAVAQRVPRLPTLLGSLGRVQRHGGGRIALLQPLDLVVLQRDQRRHDDCRPVHQHGRDLVDGGLAGTCRQHREHVVSVEHGLHPGQLVGSQGGEPELLRGGALQLCAVR